VAPARGCCGKIDGAVTMWRSFLKLKLDASGLADDDSSPRNLVHPSMTSCITAAAATNKDMFYALCQRRPTARIPPARGRPRPHPHDRGRPLIATTSLSATCRYAASDCDPNPARKRRRIQLQVLVKMLRSSRRRSRPRLAGPSTSGDSPAGVTFRNAFHQLNRCTSSTTVERRPSAFRWREDLQARRRARSRQRLGGP